MTTAFAVDLSIYAGPMDLLLYLIRREELDLTDVSLAKISSQYGEFLEVIQAIDIDAVADFLEPFSILLEMKARAVIPNETVLVDSIDEPILEEPSEQLVQRLIEYKRYRDAASILDEQSRRWQLRYSRLVNDMPSRKLIPEEQPIAAIEVWDLVSAFGRILRERQPAPTTQVVYDETPIHVYMGDIHQKVKTQRRIELQSLFYAGQHKSSMVGLFLATLELTRHHGLRAEQDGADGPMWLTPGPDFTESLTMAEVDNLRDERVRNSNLPVRPR